jgi:hypothetical protein
MRQRVAKILAALFVTGAGVAIAASAASAAGSQDEGSGNNLVPVVVDIAPVMSTDTTGWS